MSNKVIYETSVWRLSNRIRTYIKCSKCERTQTYSTPEAPQGLGLESLAHAGWTQIIDGWLCPFDSDKGTTNLLEILKKTNE